MSAQEDRPTFYELLEVPSSASFDEIETAYARIQETLGGGGLALYTILEHSEPDDFRQAIEAAYRTLINPVKRTAYDRSLEVGSETQSHLVDVSLTDRRVGEDDDLDFDIDEDLSETLTVVGGVATLPTPSNGATKHDVAAPEPTEDVEPPASSESGHASAEDAQLEFGQFSGTATVEEPSDTSPSSAQTAPEPLDSEGSDSTANRIAAAKAKPRRLYPSQDVEITGDSEFSGALLRRLRESAGASLEQVAEITKVGKGYLRAIEGNDFDALPAPVYVRGFVVEYAKVLGLDAKQVASSFMALYERYRGGGR